MIVMINSTKSHIVISRNGMILKHHPHDLTVGMACWEVCARRESCTQIICEKPFESLIPGQIISLPCAGKEDKYLVNQIWMPDKAVIILYNITNNISKQAGLTIHAEKYRRALDVLETAIVQFNPESGLIIYANASFGKRSGMNVLDLKYSSLYCLGPNIESTIHSIMESGYTSREEMFFNMLHRWKISPLSTLPDNTPLLVQLELIHIEDRRESIHRLLSGELSQILSKQEYCIISGIAKGKTRKEIQKELGIIPQQYDAQLKRIKEKLHDDNLFDIVMQLIESAKNKTDIM